MKYENKKMHASMWNEKKLYICSANVDEKKYKHNKNQYITRKIIHCFPVVALLLLLLTAPNLSAQSTSWTGQVGSSVGNGKSIVRTHGSDLVISYDEGNLGFSKRILLTNVYGFSAGMPFTPTSYLVSPSPSGNINDMRVVDDMLFFYGHSPSGGFFGWADLATNNLGYTVTPDCTSLDRLDVARNGNNAYHMVAIGTAAGGASCVVESMDVVSGTSYELAKMGYTSATQLEILDDVVITSHYVVLVGRDTRVGGNCMSIRRASATHVLADASLTQIYTYQSPTSVGFMGKVHAAGLDGDTFAVAYVQTSGEVLMHRMVSTPSGIVHVNTQQPSTLKSQDLSEMVYVPGTQHLVALWRYNLSEVMLLKPSCLVPYSAGTAATSSCNYSSIDKLDYSDFVLRDDYKMALQNSAVPFYPNSPFTCMRADTVTTVPRQLPVMAAGPSPVTIYVYTTTPIHSTYSLSLAPVSKICEKP